MTSKERLDMSNSTNTIRLHRVLRAPAERVYRAFLDPDAMAKWLPSHGFTGKGPRIGRTRRRRLPDVVHELRHRYAPFFRRNVHRADPTRANPIHRQVRRPEHAGRDAGLDHVARVACGTELEIVQQGLPSVIPVESCYLGWQESLSLLAQTLPWARCAICACAGRWRKRACPTGRASSSRVIRTTRAIAHSSPSGRCRSSKKTASSSSNPEPSCST